MSRVRTTIVIACAAILTVGCTRKEPHAAGGAHEPEAAAGETNRVAIPSAVRQNLGITFARVEQRPVTRSVRLAGRFELLPRPLASITPCSPDGSSSRSPSTSA